MDIDDLVFYIQCFQELRYILGVGYLVLCFDVVVLVRMFGEWFLGFCFCVSCKEVNYEFFKYMMWQYGQEGYYCQVKVWVDVGFLYLVKDGRMIYRI